MQLQKGALLLGGKYQIEKSLGQGGFGITYLAKQKITIKGDLGEIESVIDVAIKEFFMKDLCNRDLDSSAISNPSVGSQDFVKRFRDKFMKEAENISKLKHDNIVKVLEIFEENSTAYYVMEFVKGGSLSGHVDKNGALSEATAVYYTRQIAQALDYIHEQRINHLDVKPANVLMRDDNTIVLIDFGLAKRYDHSGEQTSSTPVGISAGYAPLEQYQTGGVTSFSPTTDIYALGASLFKMVTGDNPPDASYVNNEGLPEIEGVSDRLVNAINMAMQPRYKSRPQSIAEFVALLPTNGVAGDGDETVIMNLSAAASSPKPTNSYRPQVVETSSRANGGDDEQNKKSKLGVIVVVVFAAALVLFSGYMLAMNYQAKVELKAQQAEQAARNKAEANKKAEAEKRAAAAAAERRRQEKLRKKAASESSATVATPVTPTPTTVQTPAAGVTVAPASTNQVNQPQTPQVQQTDTNKVVYESAIGAGGVRPSSKQNRPQGNSQSRNGGNGNNGISTNRSYNNSSSTNSSANSSSQNSNSSSARNSNSSSVRGSSSSHFDKVGK